MALRRSSLLREGSGLRRVAVGSLAAQGPRPIRLLAFVVVVSVLVAVAPAADLVSGGGSRIAGAVVTQGGGASLTSGGTRLQGRVNSPPTQLSSAPSGSLLLGGFVFIRRNSAPPAHWMLYE